MNSVTVLGFDYGTQKIGVAVGQSITGTATPVTNLPARDGIPDWDQIAALLKEWQPDLLIVGLPLNMDDSESEISARARKFANRLHGRFGLKVELVDERLSSREARDLLETHASRAGNRKSTNRQKLDAVAAMTLIENWFNQQSV